MFVNHGIVYLLFSGSKQVNRNISKKEGPRIFGMIYYGGNETWKNNPTAILDFLKTLHLKKLGW